MAIPVGRQEVQIGMNPAVLPPWPRIEEDRNMPLTVHFKRAVGWGETINIHYWNAAPGDAPTT